MTRLAALFAALLIGSSGAVAQECTASAQAPDGVWTTAPNGNTLSSAPLQIMTHLRCLGCKPEVAMLLTAGPASPALKTMRVIGQKTGIEWARAVAEDPAQREGFLQSVLRSELNSSPGCRLQGQVGGITEIGGFGLIRIDIHAECVQQPTLLSAEFYSAYDGQCMYQVQLIWGPGFVALSPEGREGSIPVQVDSLRSLNRTFTRDECSRRWRCAARRRFPCRRTGQNQRGSPAPPWRRLAARRA